MDLPNFAALDDLIRRDPAGRGPANFRWQGRLLGEGQLEAACHGLAKHAHAVAIVTGFAVHDGLRYVPETDGPPGALALADALQRHGAEVTLVSDPIGMPALEAGCRSIGLQAALHTFPFEEGDEASLSRQSNDPSNCTASDAWVERFLASDFGRRLTHLISIERVGPSYLSQSHVEFEGEVPAEHRNVCHNMRGDPINGCTGKTHRLFEIVQQRQLPITTIGIGDGGNELGMGKFPWIALKTAIARGPAGRVACRIATDFTIVAGVSNWGGYALAAAFDRTRGGNGFLADWNARSECDLLQNLLQDAHCVDGLTRRRELAVDGLSPPHLAAWWDALHAIFR